MRQLANLRLWAALGALAIATLLLVLATCDDCFGRGGSQAAAATEVEKNIETTAVIVGFSSSENWRLQDGKTIGEASASLDDGRIILVASDTPGENTCPDPSIRRSCIFLANLFGDSVMWFALTEANGEKPDRVLEIAGLVDMLDSGSRGVLANGWVVPLANGVKKSCGEESGTLRDFINTYGSDKSMSKLNLITDQVDEVVCTG